MAIIYHNYLLALGLSCEIKSLRDVLLKPRYAAVLLSCELYKIYYPDKPRNRRLKDFGNCGSFLGSTIPWDVAIGMPQIRKISDIDYGASLLKDRAEAEMTYSDDVNTNILYFTFSSGHSEPEEGFKNLSRQYPNVVFIIYSDSEDGADIKVQLKNGKWNKDEDL